MFTSSNPALAGDGHQFYASVGEQGSMADAKQNVASLNGVVNKTALLVLITVAGGGAGYQLVSSFPAITWISSIAAFVIVLGLGFVIRGNPRLAMYIAPVFAIVEGVFLGLLTGALDSMLVSMKSVQAAAAGGGAAATGSISLAMPAFLITISVMLAMLGLYTTRILRPTRKFTTIVSIAVTGIMVTYAASFVMGMFGVQMPFLSIGSALKGGTPALIGLGLNVVILGVASLVLIIDFGRIEEIVNSGAPKYMEWYGAFALLVTLAWIYLEAVKLCFRLYLMFGRRN